MNGQSPDDMRMQMRMQMDIIKQCYGDCVNDFKAAELSGGEKKCLGNCATRQISSMMLLQEAQNGFMAKQGGMGGQF
jgi:hypothetical protein